jgi:hypothetical protein
MPRALIDLPGLVTAVRFKTDLLRHLSRSSAEEWLEHVNRFIDAVAASELEDATALSVLLADLAEEIRVLLSQDAVAQTRDGEPPIEAVLGHALSSPNRPDGSRLPDAGAGAPRRRPDPRW